MALLTALQVVDPIQTTLNGGLYAVLVPAESFLHLRISFDSAVQRSNVFTNTTVGAVSSVNWSKIPYTFC